MLKEDRGPLDLTLLIEEIVGSKAAKPTIATKTTSKSSDSTNSDKILLPKCILVPGIDRFFFKKL